MEKLGNRHDEGLPLYAAPLIRPSGTFPAGEKRQFHLPLDARVKLPRMPSVTA